MTNTARKKRIKTQELSHSVRLAILFCVLVFGLIVFSLVAKLLVVVKKSTFDGNHRFTLVIQQKDNRASVVSFAPVNESVSILRIAGVAEVTDIGKTLEIPIDGTITANFLRPEINGKNIQDTMRLFVMRFPTLQTSLTPIDLARLWLFVQQLSPHTAYEKSLSLGEKNADVRSDLVIDKLSAELFADETIAAEKISVQIINAASVFGLGSRCARFMNNMGGNVVSVTTAETTLPKTTVSYFGKKSYTVFRLEHLLGVTALPMQTPGIADILVTLGKDKENTTVF